VLVLKKGRVGRFLGKLDTCVKLLKSDSVR
jgi:hypothetical protein